jgi:type II secretory pathway component PulK
MAETILADRDAQAFTDTGQLTQRLPVGQGQTVGLSVVTSFFLVQANIVQGRSQRSTRALINRKRSNNSARVLWHHPVYPILEADDQDSKDKG